METKVQLEKFGSNSYTAPAVSSSLGGQLGPLSNFISPFQTELDLHEKWKWVWAMKIQQKLFYFRASPLDWMNKLGSGKWYLIFSVWSDWDPWLLCLRVPGEDAHFHPVEEKKTQKKQQFLKNEMKGYTDTSISFYIYKYICLLFQLIYKLHQLYKMAICQQLYPEMLFKAMQQYWA